MSRRSRIPRAQNKTKHCEAQNKKKKTLLQGYANCITGKCRKGRGRTAGESVVSTNGCRIGVPRTLCNQLRSTRFPQLGGKVFGSADKKSTAAEIGCYSLPSSDADGLEGCEGNAGALALGIEASR